MLRRTHLLAALALVAVPLPVLAQQTTERFIPIGQSPSVSGRTAIIGTVVGYADGVLTVDAPAGLQRVRVLPRTLIWIDRSALQQTNVSGAAADLQAGRRVEVKFVDPQARSAAEWVKVQGR